MLQQRVKRVERMVKLLKDPDPRYVSFVDFGANQTPFNSLKRAKKVTRLEADRRKSANSEKETKMAKRRRKRVKPLSVKKSANNTALRKLAFAKEQFPTEDEVQAWLDENEYEGDLEIVSVDKSTFEVADEAVSDDDFETIRGVPAGEGVTGFVGPLTKSADEDDADDEDAAEKANKSNKRKAKKSAKSEIAEKFDHWAAWMSDGTSVDEIIKDGMRDGTPPGFDEIVFSTVQAMANSLKGNGDDLETKLANIGGEMAGLIFKVHEVFAALAEGDDDDAEKSAKTYSESIQKVLDAYAEEVEDDEPVQTSAPDDAPDALKDVIALVKSTSADTLKALSGLADDVKKATATADEAMEAAETATKRTKRLEEKAPSKKATSQDDPDEDDGVDPEEAKKTEAVERKLARGLLGM